MTSERRRRANWANAQMSTGPRSAAGKRRASRNAKRHGLTTLLPEDIVAEWVDVILDDPKLQDVELDRDVMTLATALAEAEARLERARRAESRFLEDVHALDRGSVHLETRIVTETLVTIYDWGPSEFRDGRWRAGEPYEASERVAVKTRTKTKSYDAELRRLARYRKEAECARLRALKAWSGFLKELPDPETGPEKDAGGGWFSETNPLPPWLRPPKSKTKPGPRVLPRMKAKDIRISGGFDEGIPDIPVQKLPFKLLF
jgi:hypothetical protein